MSFRSPLDGLPLFASDIEIAEAIVGKEYAKEWAQTRLPTLAGKAGFPPTDAFHGGRPVPLVRRFYENYLGLGVSGVVPAGAADPSAWKSASRARKRTS